MKSVVLIKIEVAEAELFCYLKDSFTVSYDNGVNISFLLLHILRFQRLNVP
jgi:hypothetical protein